MFVRRSTVKAAGHVGAAAVLVGLALAGVAPAAATAAPAPAVVAPACTYSDSAGPIAGERYGAGAASTTTGPVTVD
jgi:hypothetical protein